MHQGSVTEAVDHTVIPRRSDMLKPVYSGEQNIGMVSEQIVEG